jgi:hypothetical protein
MNDQAQDERWIVRISLGSARANRFAARPGRDGDLIDPVLISHIPGESK